ncbi:MAG: SMC-Scp complex subunit ScpB, partial [Endomicrobiaceae bacterium]|nr:SMC-Scp complex subunit ScpB [Endomicrobiaceae bacterium]
EVLAIVAYKQPITRAEIDNIRGVDSGGVIDTLLDRKFIKIVGRKESLGRPLLYGTTQEFLRHFGLSHLSELPIIENINDVLKRDEELVQELPFEKDDNLIDSNEDEKKESISETIIEQDKNEFEDVLQIKDASTYENE